MSTRKTNRIMSTRKSENSTSAQVERDEENHVVGMVIRYIFAVNRLKTVIHGDQIKKIYLSGGTQNYSSIISKVKRKLNEVFGYELIDLSGLKYILVNKISNPDLESSPQETADRILLFLTLTYIFMSCDNDTAFIKENDLWAFFSSLKIVNNNNFQHTYFGNINKKITMQFVDQLYLIRRKINDNNTEEISYEWGPRANAEISRRSVLEFVSKVYDNRPISNWPIQVAAIRNFENPIEES